MKELYLIHTRILPAFLDVMVQIEEKREVTKSHAEFISKAKKKYPEFDIPYLALLENGKILLPMDVSGATIHWSVKGLPNYNITLDQYIEQCIGGYYAPDKSRQSGKKDPITAVVEFSPKELYPDAMKALVKKYKIKRIFVE